MGDGGFSARFSTRHIPGPDAKQKQVLRSAQDDEAIYEMSSSKVS